MEDGWCGVSQQYFDAASMPGGILEMPRDIVEAAGNRAIAAFGELDQAFNDGLGSPHYEKAVSLLASMTVSPNLRQQAGFYLQIAGADVQEEVRKVLKEFGKLVDESIELRSKRH